MFVNTIQTDLHTFPTSRRKPVQFRVTLYGPSLNSCRAFVP